MTENLENKVIPEVPEEKPPFFRSWKGMYWLLIGFLAFQVILYYLITLYYS